MKTKLKALAQKVKKSPKNEESQLAKITNNTLENERKEILDNGQKFKYPVQYSKHKLVINTIIIGVVFMIVGVIIVLFQLYSAQSSSDILYRITTVVPFPVANVDGENVLYSDYLMRYRADMVASEKKKNVMETIEDDAQRSKVYKQKAMEESIRDAYVIKIAREKGISVSREEVNKLLEDARKVKNQEISEIAFNKIVADNFGLSMDEYRRIFIELPLLRQKVSVEVDASAKKLKDEVYELLKTNNNDFAKVHEKYGEKVLIEAPGAVKHFNVDSGRTAAALKLQPGEISQPFASDNNGYYIVKLISKTDTEVTYESINIKFAEFDAKLKQLETDGKITKYIKLEE